jgi:hypothetical protein
MQGPHYVLQAMPSNIWSINAGILIYMLNRSHAFELTDILCKLDVQGWRFNLNVDGLAYCRTLKVKRHCHERENIIIH